MKQYIFGLFLCLVLFSSCEEKEPLDAGTGFLYISASKNIDVITKAEADLEPMSVAICKAATGDTVQFFKDYATDLGNEKVQLPAGKYYVKAGTIHSGKAAFDKPFYSGADTIEVVKATIRESEVVCMLANVKVTVAYSDLLKRFFTGYKATISNPSGALTFEEKENRAGYYTPGKLNVVLDLINNDGTHYQIVKEISGTKAREHYRLTFSVGEEPDSPEAGGEFEVTVDETTNDINCELKVPVFTDDHGRNMPKIETTAKDRLSIKETNPKDEQLSTTVTSKNGLQVLALKLVSKYFNETNGLPNYIDLMKMDEAMRTKLTNDLGINIPPLSSTSSEATLDFKGLLGKIPLLEGKKTTHSITVIARDMLGQQVEDTVVVEVRPNVSVLVEANPWARFALLKIVAGSPDNIIVNYKSESDASSDGTNIEIDPSSTFVNTDGDYEVECVIPGLTKNTSYIYNVKADIEQPIEGSFKTNDEPIVPNLDFEEWKDIYPNKDGKNVFWATGNDGVKSAGKSPNTTQADDYQHGLKAARLESLGDVMLAGTAAGNLFIGTFNTNITNPPASPSFGRDYAGRPTKLTGYFKYNPADANYGSYTDAVDNGMTKDIADIYIWLKDASGTQIGYGRFNAGQKVDEYTKFEIDIKYTDKIAAPRTMAIVISSSKYGGVFSGNKVIGKMGIGSVLYVDNFNLFFDYNEKSFK